jgi:hypothetical protein
LSIYINNNQRRQDEYGQNKTDRHKILNFRFKNIM